MNRYDVVKRLLDSQAINFEAIGKVVAELGPSIALSDDPWDNFCGTMRIFIRIYRLPGPWGPLSQLENLGDLAKAGSELRQ